MRLIIPFITCLSVSAIDDNVTALNETAATNVTVAPLQDTFIPAEEEEPSQLKDISSNLSDDTDSQVNCGYKADKCFWKNIEQKAQF